MLAVSVMTMLCVTGIAFYARFLIALFGDRQKSWIGYVVHLRPGPPDDTKDLVEEETEAA